MTIPVRKHCSHCLGYRYVYSFVYFRGPAELVPLFHLNISLTLISNLKMLSAVMAIANVKQ